MGLVGAMFGYHYHYHYIALTQSKGISSILDSAVLVCFIYFITVFEWPRILFHYLASWSLQWTVRLLLLHVLWKVSLGWHENYINYSLNNQINILCYRRFDFTSEVFIRTDFRWRSSVCKNLSIRGSVGSSPSLDSCCRSSWCYRILTYWQSVSPDEHFRCEVETSITKYVNLVV